MNWLENLINIYDELNDDAEAEVTTVFDDPSPVETKVLAEDVDVELPSPIQNRKIIQIQIKVASHYKWMFTNRMIRIEQMRQRMTLRILESHQNISLFSSIGIE